MNLTLYGQPGFPAPGSPGFDQGNPYGLDEVSVTASRPKGAGFDFGSLFSSLPGIIYATSAAFGGNSYQPLNNNQQPPEQQKPDYTTVALIAGIVVILIVAVKLLKK